MAVQLRRLIAIALLVIACAPVTTPASPPTVPATSPTPAPSIPELGITGGALPAGRYAMRGFDPRITVDLDGSWESLAQRNGYTSLVQVSRPTGSNPNLARTLIQIALVDAIVGDVSVFEPTTANAAVAVIQRNGTIDVVDTSKSKIGGLTGAQVTGERPSDGTEPFLSYNVSVVLEVPPGSIGLTPGQRLWIAFFETEQGLVAIVVNGQIEGWDATLEAAEPVLEEIRFSVP